MYWCEDELRVVRCIGMKCEVCWCEGELREVRCIGVRREVYWCEGELRVVRCIGVRCIGVKVNYLMPTSLFVSVMSSSLLCHESVRVCEKSHLLLNTRLRRLDADKLTEAEVCC